MNTLEDESVWLTLDTQNTFHAEDVETFCPKQIANPIVQPVGVEVAGGCDADRCDFVIMFVVWLKFAFNDCLTRVPLQRVVLGIRRGDAR